MINWVKKHLLLLGVILLPLLVIYWLWIRYHGEAIYVNGSPEISLVKWFTRYPFANPDAEAKAGFNSTNIKAVPSSTYNRFMVGAVIRS